MTRTEFFEIFGKLAKEVPFRLTGHGCIRTAKGDSCPITAVYKKVFQKKRMSTGDYPIAAEKLGLPFKFACEVADAADATFIHHRNYRQRLLKAAGLTERK